MRGMPSAFAARAAGSISEQDAHAIGVAAYLYLYPLVTMDLTRRQLTNVAKAEGAHAPMNTFANLPAFPPANLKAVVRSKLRYAVFQRVAGSDEGADDRLGA